MKKSHLYYVGLVAAFLVVAAGSPLGAQGPPADAVRLGALIETAYGANPEIAAAKEKWRAAVEKYRVVTGYPDPQLMVTYFPEPIETRLGPQDWNLTLSQAIPFPGKLTSAGEVAVADARIAKLSLDKTVRGVVQGLRESWYELFYIRRAKKIAAANIELLDHMRKVAETAYAGDRAVFLDVVKSQSEVAQLRYDLLLLTDLERTELTRLNALLNRTPDAEVGSLSAQPARPPAYSLEEIYALAEEYQEGIRIAGAKVDRAEAGLALARYQNLPNFKLGLFYGAIGHPDVASPPPDEGDDAIGVQFGISLPLWIGKNRGRVAAAAAERERARAMAQNTVNSARTRIHALYFRMQNAERLVTLYGKEMLPQAAKAMALAETWFSEGEGSFSDFIETRAVWYNFQLSLARAEADYGKFLARLETEAGRDLTMREAFVAGERGKK